MARTIRACCSIAVAAALFAVFLSPRWAEAAQEETVNAFVAWQGAGQAMRTGTDETSFIGAIAGILYVMTDEGPVDSGQMVCPAALIINGKDRSQHATGRCSITAHDGAQIFARLDCNGVFLVGCGGEFVLTGGTQRFAGITGGGHFTIRRNTRETVGVTDKTMTETASGIMFWPALHYKIP